MSPSPIHIRPLLVAIILVVVILTGCKKDDDGPEPVISAPQEAPGFRVVFPIDKVIYPGAGTEYQFNYDADGRLMQIDYSESASGERLFYLSFDYLENGQIGHFARIDAKDGSKVFENWFTYDGENRRVSSTPSNNQLQYFYHYDSEDRMVRTDVIDLETGDSTSVTQWEHSGDTIHRWARYFYDDGTSGPLKFYESQVFDGTNPFFGLPLSINNYSSDLGLRPRNLVTRIFPPTSVNPFPQTTEFRIRYDRGRPIAYYYAIIPNSPISEVVYLD